MTSIMHPIVLRALRKLLSTHAVGPASFSRCDTSLRRLFCTAALHWHDEPPALEDHTKNGVDFASFSVRNDSLSTPCSSRLHERLDTTLYLQARYHLAYLLVFFCLQK